MTNKPQTDKDLVPKQEDEVEERKQYIQIDWTRRHR